MAKHGGGNFNNNGSDFFNNIFDLNFDGKVDGMDFFLMQQIMENTQTEDEPDDEWRLYSDEGDDYGISPYDYDSREEYLDAVIGAVSNMEIHADDAEDGSAYGIDQ